MKRSVFISYSSEDKAIAEQLCAYLEANSVWCWIAPRDVTPGKNYGAAILDAIDECHVFVLILSSNSNKSNQVVREVERAASGDAVILPFRIENVQPSRNIEFYVSAAHWLDASVEPVQSHFTELLTAIQNWQKGANLPIQAGAPTAVPPTLETPSRFPVFTLLIVAVVGAVVIWVGLLYKISHRAQTENLAVQSSAPPESASPAKHATPEPSSTMAVPIISPPEIASTENASPSPTLPVVRKKPGEPLRAPTESPVPSVTAIPSRLRPGQHLTSPTPAASVSPTSTAITVPIIQEVAASSFLNDNSRPKLAFDGNPATAWVPKGRALEQSLIVHFKSPALLRSVSILNGDGRDEEHYRLNNRVRTLRLILSDGTTQMLTFEDTLKPQRFGIAHPTTADWVKFEIVTLFRGSDNARTSISEITFNQPSQ